MPIRFSAQNRIGMDQTFPFRPYLMQRHSALPPNRLVHRTPCAFACATASSSKRDVDTEPALPRANQRRPRAS